MMMQQHVQLRLSLEKLLTHQQLSNQLLHMFQSVHSINHNMNHNCSMTITQQLIEKLNFYCYKDQSTVRNAGYGVFLRSNPHHYVKRGTIVSLYPGLVYESYEPKFFQSIGNQFLLQRKDFTCIDGNDRYLSKIMYKSCANRDAIYIHNSNGSGDVTRLHVCDSSWLQFRYHTCENDLNHRERLRVLNPYNIGHYINNPMNNSQNEEANVMYYEYDFHVSSSSSNDENSSQIWPIDLQYLIPNVHYQPVNTTTTTTTTTIKSIVLVALRDIEDGEELFASYHNLVDDGGNL